MIKKSLSFLCHAGVLQRSVLSETLYKASYDNVKIKMDAVDCAMQCEALMQVRFRPYKRKVYITCVKAIVVERWTNPFRMCSVTCFTCIYPHTLYRVALFGSVDVVSA